jgi:hypothetical protein
MQGYGAAQQHLLLARKDEVIRTSLQIATDGAAEHRAEVTAHWASSAHKDSLVDWCSACRHANVFAAPLHQRSCTVREGTIPLRMPLVRCRCGGYVEIPWQTVDKRARYWLDVELDGIRHYLAGMSYRLTADASSTTAQTNISHLQSWRTMQEVGELAEVTAADLAPCPRSVMLDKHTSA